jgi:hypothetical protein
MDNAAAGKVEVESNSGRYWGWLPTANGAIRRDSVTSMRIERVDGQFQGGATSSWTIVVTTTASSDEISLRPLFLDPIGLATFVDLAFPGAAFELLPPSDIAAVLPQEEGDEGMRFLSDRGAHLADIIRSIGEGLGGGDAYEPFGGQRGAGGRGHSQPTMG